MKKSQLSIILGLSIPAVTAIFLHLYKKLSQSEIWNIYLEELTKHPGYMSFYF